MKLDFTYIPVIVTDYPGFVFRHINQYTDSLFKMTGKERVFYFYITDSNDTIDEVMDQIKSHYADHQYDAVIIGAHSNELYIQILSELFNQKIDHYLFTFIFNKINNLPRLSMNKFVRDENGDPVEDEPPITDHQDFTFVYDCSFDDVTCTDNKLMFTIIPNLVNTVRYMEKVYSAISIGSNEDGDKKLENMIYRMRFIMSNRGLISGEKIPPMRILFNQQPQFIFEISSMYDISPDFLIAPYMDPKVLDKPLYIGKIDVDYGLNTLE